MSTSKQPTPDWKSEKEIARLYELYKTPFIQFLLKYYALDEQTAADIYQESFTALCQNIRAGRYKEENASLRTYLFKIGKNRTCDWLRKNRLQAPEDMQNLLSEWIEDNNSEQEWHQAQDIARLLVQEADDGCREVLTLYYWERLKMSEIALRMNYQSEQVAKNKKSSCLRRLTYELRRRLEATDIFWKQYKKK